MLSLEWSYEPRPTVIHAVAGIDAGIMPVNIELGKAIAKPLVATIERLRVYDVDRHAFWLHLLAASASSDSIAQIVTTALKRAMGPVGPESTTPSQLLGLIGEVISAGASQLIDGRELETRSRPLKLQWDTCGPGLLNWITTRTEAGTQVERARLIVVQPVFGGGGCAHLSANSAHMEAMLANPDDTLPEVLRLTWMVAQLNNDLPKYSESINRRLISTISGLAMLPVTLEAGGHLGLSSGYGRQALEHAIGMWHAFPGDQALVAEIVDNWWQTVTGGSFRWSTALHALDRMMKPLTLVTK